MSRNPTVVSAALARQLENKIASLQLTISNREKALKEQDDTTRRLRENAERDAHLIDDKTNQINALNRRVSELDVDSRISDQNTAIVEAKYKAAIEIIKIITGKDTF